MKVNGNQNLPPIEFIQNHIDYQSEVTGSLVLHEFHHGNS